MKESIIYIDDEQANLDAFRMVFGEIYNIILCTKAKEVFKVVKENEIKVIVSDQRMPEITGLDLCERVRQIDPRIICIILTAFADIGVTVQAINQGGIYRYMLKPWDIDEMKLTLANALDKYNLIEENKKLIARLEDKNKELNETAQTIKASENQLKVIIESTPLIMFLTSKKLQILKINKPGLKLSKRAEMEVIGMQVGKALNCSYAIYKECGSSDVCEDCDIIRTINDSIDNNKDFYKVESRLPLIIEGTEDIRDVLIFTKVLNDTEEKLVLVSIDDISEQKKVEMEITAMNEELRVISNELMQNEIILEAQNRELIKAKEKAEESDKLKTSFLANISHEIRTPLNGIMGFANLLLKKDQKKDQVTDFLNIIYSSSQQLLTIVNDVLDISKIETGQIVLRNINMNINDLMNELYEFHILQANKKNLKFELYNEFNKDLVIITDYSKLHQALNNVICNALKFTQKGTIKLGYKVNLDNLEFFVEDTGIGISKSNQSKIFDRFYQGDSSLIRAYGGNGIGLTIAKYLVEILGGSLKVDSEFGIGSKFTINLPLKDMIKEQP